MFPIFKVFTSSKVFSWKPSIINFPLAERFRLQLRFCSLHQKSDRLKLRKMPPKFKPASSSSISWLTSIEVSIDRFRYPEVLRHIFFRFCFLYRKSGRTKTPSNSSVDLSRISNSLQLKTTVFFFRHGRRQIHCRLNTVFFLEPKTCYLEVSFSN